MRTIEQHLRRRAPVFVAAILAFVVVGSTSAVAEPALHLSKSADHATTDDIFAPGDDLFILVTDVVLEDIVAANFTVTTAGPGLVFQGDLTDNGDGTFSGMLGNIAGPPGEWAVGITISNDTDDVLLETTFTMEGDPGDEGEEEEEDEEEEEEQEDDEAYDVVVSGILEIDGDLITVAEITFVLSPDVLIRRMGEVLDADALEDGLRVQVRGRYQEEALHALHIRIFANRGNGSAMEPRERGPWFSGRFLGTVESLDDEAVVVSGVSFELAGSTEIRGGDGKPLEVGDPVKVFYLRQEEGDHLALRIIIMVDDDGELEVEGVVTEVGEESITIDGFGEFAVDAATTIVARGGVPLQLSEINVGDLVEIKAVSTETGYLAVRIRLEEAITIESDLEGEVDGSLLVAGREILLVEETLIVGPGNAILSREHLRTGARVMIQAVAMEGAGKTAATTYVAATVLVKSFASTTGTEGRDAQPGAFTLHGNYPNPFNPSTTIAFDVHGTAPQMLTLSVYDALGRRVRTLLNAELSSGTYEVTWDGRDAAGASVASGIYLYRIESTGTIATRAMTLVK